MSHELPAPHPGIDSSRDVPAPENPLSSGSDRAPGDHYQEVVGTLLTDAFERKTVRDLSDVLARTLALIAFRCGPEAAGQMHREWGECLRLFAEHARSQREAEELKEKGIKPH